MIRLVMYAFKVNRSSIIYVVLAISENAVPRKSCLQCACHILRFCTVFDFLKVLHDQFFFISSFSIVWQSKQPYNIWYLLILIFINIFCRIIILYNSFNKDNIILVVLQINYIRAMYFWTIIYYVTYVCIQGVLCNWNRP